MNMEKIEKGFTLINSNIELIETSLQTDFYDAFVEQNATFLGSAELAAVNLDGQEASLLSALTENNDQLRALNLTKQEWQKLFQFVLLKGSQVAPLQHNHAFTPDSITSLFHFIIECLHPENSVRILEMGSGTGNMAENLLVNSTKNMDYVGFEVDDLLLDLSASMSEVIGTQATFMQVDAVQSQLMEPVDIVISDLPIGFYPDDQLAQNFELAQKEGHSFAHHLMIEESMKYLKESGFSIFLAPADLLTSSQSGNLKNWLGKTAHLAAVITLPESLFKHDAKAIYILKKTAGKPTFVYPLEQLNDRQHIQDFMVAFKAHFKG
ncbi:MULTISPECIES: class I SAM-dependent methyltransferase [unclassified Lactococcus]|uniref:class I SAM-dependent methyltransferase n=1 Tax=unclassified Lactococcus TaxID=2643510 RepID=UPI0011C7FF8B|nr:MULTISPECIES: class I SAM-dependent methyltransferase [unclassified Lactococcus]MQW22876.1 N-6 DNA methylase [Lactococcus sp. dk101]TXK44577.1 class I SAM-dependent methyltransferase [Lactococcus sp. dk310]TXK50430.1 class I SAM-dependent methyltransferase [Lactococcus sp. dk322]